jgi:hypothetical protein
MTSLAPHKWFGDQLIRLDKGLEVANSSFTLLTLAFFKALRERLPNHLHLV